MPPPSSRRNVTPPELLEKFQRAVALCSQRSAPELSEARRLLLECVQGDPGNLIFAESFLSVLDRMPPRRGRWRGFWNRVAFEQALRNTDWERVVLKGPTLLVARPYDGPVLCGMGQALLEMGHRDVALRYWFAADDAHEIDQDVQRQCARAFHRAGLFELAIQCWQRVADHVPGDSEAAKMLDALAGSTDKEQPPQSDSPKASATYDLPDLDRVFMESDRRYRGGDLTGAKDILSRAAPAYHGDLRVVEKLEDLELEAARQRMNTASQTCSAEDRDQLLADLNADLVRREIEVYGSRAARYPTEHRWRLLLAESLKSAGNFYQACLVLSEIPPEFASQIELHVLWGECLQYQQQFDQALEHYQLAAVRAREERSLGPLGLLASYRAGVLALQLGDESMARPFLQAVIETQPDYKDTQQHLDKIDSIRDKDGFSRDL